jgi:hypothetical protein
MTWDWPRIADGCSNSLRRPPCDHARSICGDIASSGDSKIPFQRSKYTRTYQPRFIRHAHTPAAAGHGWRP